MGTYYRTYLGCYLKIPVKNEPKTETVYKKPSGKVSKTRFNPETGEEYTKDTRIVNVKVYPEVLIYDRDDLGEDTFDSPPYAGENYEEFHIFKPNSSKDNKLKMETQYDYNFSLENLIPELEISRFRRKYAKYIDYYEKKYPEMEIHFGIVRSGS